MKQVTLDRWQEEYRDLRPNASRFSEMLMGELQEMLRKNHVPLAVPIEYRVKSWPSIEDKIGRKGFNGTSLSDLRDLVGLRLILLFRKDVPAVCQLIESVFEVSSRCDQAEELSPQEFGYQSTHYVVRAPKAWLSIPTFSSFYIFQAEIQVRTLAQHMWAAASHVLQYKQEESVPPPLRRTISRISALLETVDLEFDRVFKEREEYRSRVRHERKSRKLNSDVLAATLDDLLPAKNKGVLEPYSLLVWELDKLGIKTSGQLALVLEKHLPAAVEDDRQYTEQLRLRGSIAQHTQKGVFTHTGLLRLVLQREFGRSFFGGVLEDEEEKATAEGGTKRHLTLRSSGRKPQKVRSRRSPS
jgi:putative GTP pyrophosphokinase